MEAKVDLHNQDWVQGFLQATHKALGAALREATRDALAQVAAQVARKMMQHKVSFHSQCILYRILRKVSLHQI